MRSDGFCNRQDELLIAPAFAATGDAHGGLASRAHAMRPSGTGQETIRIRDPFPRRDSRFTRHWIGEHDDAISEFLGGGLCTSQRVYSARNHMADGAPHHRIAWLRRLFDSAGKTSGDHLLN